MARTKDVVLAPEQKELMEKEYLDFVKPSTYGNKANPSSCDSLYDDVENPELRAIVEKVAATTPYDLVNWKSEGTVMTMDTVDWAKDDVSAWASQVMKYNDKYYLYYCSWDKSGKQSIGVAVADSPTGTFVDIGEPLVRGSVTKPQLSTFNDIDPTAWVETDENGEERRDFYDVYFPLSLEGGNKEMQVPDNPDELFAKHNFI
ncbi:Glycoside hydrolase, family 43, partial [human gut metagenome]